MSVVMAKRIIEETQQTAFKRGDVARFVRLDQVWGAKLYESHNDRNYCYGLQKRAWEHQAAPAVGCKFTGIDNEGEKYFAFITECVKETLRDAYGKLIYLRDDVDFDSWDDMDMVEAGDAWDEFARGTEFQELITKITSAGISSNDLHWNNVGRLNSGRLVAIDFSHEHLLRKG